jgi:mannose-1-phosphate guanylyltransferase
MREEQEMSSPLALGRKDRWAVILAGGEGKRLRSYIHRIAGRECPKQYFPIVGTTTLLEQTLARVSLRVAPEHTLVVVNRAHQVFYSAISNTRPELELLIQPHCLGTAPGILYALLAIAKRSPNASVAIFPSDHYVGDDDRFMQYVDSAFGATLRHPDTPIVLGVAPFEAELGYGWIEPGTLISNSAEPPLLRISGFWEKPPLHIARELFHRACLLNTFIIVGTVSSLIGTIASALPNTYAAMNVAQSALGHALEEVMIRAIYSRLARADFSQSVLAKHPDKFAVMSISDVEWSDLGVPERVIALRSREIKVGRPIEVPHSSADRISADDSAAYWAIRAENLTKHMT